MIIIFTNYWYHHHQRRHDHRHHQLILSISSSTSSWSLSSPSSLWSGITIIVVIFIIIIIIIVICSFLGTYVRRFARNWKFPTTTERKNSGICGRGSRLHVRLSYPKIQLTSCNFFVTFSNWMWSISPAIRRLWVRVPLGNSDIFLKKNSSKNNIVTTFSNVTKSQSIALNYVWYLPWPLRCETASWWKIVCYSSFIANSEKCFWAPDGNRTRNLLISGETL